MKTKEELSALKEEVETLSAKLRELTDDELSEVTGGAVFGIKVRQAVKDFRRSADIQADACKSSPSVCSLFKGYVDELDTNFADSND